MRSDRFSVLIFAGDDHLTQEIAARLRSHFQDFPLVLEFESASRRLVSEFKNQLHGLVILAAGSGDQEMPQTILQLQAVSGSARILYLGVNPLPEGFQGVDRFELPIVKWDVLLDWVTGCIPDHLAVRHRLRRLENPLRKALEEYSRKYESGEGRVASAEQGPSAPLIQAPLAWLSLQSGRDRSGAADTPARDSAVVAPSVTFVEDQVARRAAFWREAGVVGVLVLVAALTRILANPDAPDHWLSLKTLSTGLAWAGVFGFLSARALDRFAFSRQK